MSGQGTKIPHASLLNEKKKKRKKAFITDETLNNQEGRKTQPLSTINHPVLYDGCTRQSDWGSQQHELLLTEAQVATAANMQLRLKIPTLMGLPGSPRVRLQAASAGGLGSSPGQGARSPMPQLRICIPQLKLGAAKYICICFKNTSAEPLIWCNLLRRRSR